MAPKHAIQDEMILSAEKGLKEIENKVIEAQGRGFKLIRELHTESQASGQGKVLIDVNVMKENFSKFLDNLIGPSKITELQKLSGQVYVATMELPKQLSTIRELAREHSKCLLRYTNVYVPKHEELVPIMVPARAYRANLEKGKKTK